MTSEHRVLESEVTSKVVDVAVRQELAIDTHGYEYISISWAGTSPSGKTNIYSITNNHHGSRLGEIKWYGPWRQYVFFPVHGTIYSRGCLVDIADFMRNNK